MTYLVVVLAAAALTYTSRAAALSLLPAPHGQLKVLVERIPAPLFAGLAVLTLLGADLAVPPAPVLLAATAALALAVTRSLVTILAGGLAAYAAGLWLL